jgi:ribosome-binding factor A
MRLRTVPELRFSLDTSMAYGAKIDKILHDINVDGDVAKDSIKDIEKDDE